MFKTFDLWMHFYFCNYYPIHIIHCVASIKFILVFLVSILVHPEVILKQMLGGGGWIIIYTCWSSSDKEWGKALKYLFTWRVRHLVFSFHYHLAFNNFFGHWILCHFWSISIKWILLKWGLDEILILATDMLLVVFSLKWLWRLICLTSHIDYHTIPAFDFCWHYGKLFSFMNHTLMVNQDYVADEIGVLSPNQLQVDELYSGEVIFTLVDLY